MSWDSDRITLGLFLWFNSTVTCHVITRAVFIRLGCHTCEHRSLPLPPPAPPSSIPYQGRPDDARTRPARAAPSEATRDAPPGLGMGSIAPPAGECKLMDEITITISQAAGGGRRQERRREVAGHPMGMDEGWEGLHRG